MSHNALTIRAATARDDDALARLSAREAGWHLGGLALLAEANGTVIAAIGLTSGTVLADPIEPDAAAIRSLRQRRSRLLAHSSELGAARPARWLASTQDTTDDADSETLTIRVPRPR